VIFTIGASFLSLLAIPTLWLIKHAFDVVIPQRDVALLALVGLGIVGFRLLASGMRLALRYHVLHTIKAVIKELRYDLLGSLYSRSRSELGQSDPALIQAKIVQDSERVDGFSNTLIYGFLPAIFATAVLVAYLAYLNWQLLILAGVLVPVIWWVNRRFSGASSGSAPACSSLCGKWT
jgi:ABC-type multidrug transport system fused ATPase/permease subunit